MPRCLYLDTARLGRMSPGAQRTLQGFSRFAGDLGGSVHFDDLLWHGIDELSPGVRNAYPELADWRGIEALKDLLRQLVQLPPHARVLLASRSAQLMQLASTLLCRPCRNILVTDLGWQPYHDLLAKECRRTNRRMTLVRLRDAILRDQMDANDVAERISEVYQEHHCDGLFLTAVSNYGIRLPIKEVVNAVERSSEVRFIALDGAQDFGHTEPPHAARLADFYLAGTHKWLGSYLPLGLSFYCPVRSWGVVDGVLHDVLSHGSIDDPLLKYASNVDDQRAETVNFAPIFAAHGAAGDAVVTHSAHGAAFNGRLRNIDAVAELAPSVGWAPQLPHATLRTGIVLLQAQSKEYRSASPQTLRTHFHMSKVALTAYEQGRVRLSMPAALLESADLNWLYASLQQVSHFPL